MNKCRKYITVGHDHHGKRIRKWISADTQTELNAKIKELTGHGRDTSTFGKYAEKWFEVYKGNREVNTQEYYSTALLKLKPLNHKLLCDITRTDIQEIIQDNWEHPRTCEKLESTAHQIFGAAIADGILDVNPVSGIHLPPKKRKKTEDRAREIFTDAELDAIREAEKALPPKHRLFLDFAMCLGLRPEEIRALNRDSFDLGEGTVTISSAQVFKDRKPVIKSTKNYQNRTIPMPKPLIASVRAYNADLNGFYLFGGKSCDTMTKDEYRRFYEVIFNVLEPVVGKVTFYVFRHTRGTQLYYLTQKPDGISTKLAAWYMGHSEIVFLNTYSHIDQSKENLDLLRKVI